MSKATRIDSADLSHPIDVSGSCRDKSRHLLKNSLMKGHKVANVDPGFVNSGVFIGECPGFSGESDHFWRGAPPILRTGVDQSGVNRTIRTNRTFCLKKKKKKKKNYKFMC